MLVLTLVLVLVLVQVLMLLTELVLAQVLMPVPVLVLEAPVDMVDRQRWRLRESFTERDRRWVRKGGGRRKEVGGRKIKGELQKETELFQN